MELSTPADTRVKQVSPPSETGVKVSPPSETGVKVSPLGETALMVSRFGVGLAALGRPGYINIGHRDDIGPAHDPALMEARTHAVLDAAYAEGIRYFDAARSYGRAEEFLGSWLRARGLGAGDCYIASKWGYTYTADWRTDAPVHEVKEHTLAVLERQMAETRERLGPWLALYQVHSATLDSGVLTDRAVLERLALLREGGVHVGLTLTGAKQAKTLECAMAVEVAGVRLFETVQATWNVLERSAEHVLRAAHDAGMGVILKEVLANGRLTERNADGRFRPQLDALRTQAARLGTSVDALALAAAIERPWADVVLSGATSVAQLRSNLKSQTVVLDDEAHDALDRLREDPVRYWALRSELAWN